MENPSNRILNLIATLSSTDLEALRRIIESPKRSTDLLRLIDSALMLHRGDELHLTETSAEALKQPETARIVSNASEETLSEDKRAFYALLEDRDVLRTTADVVALFNQLFEYSFQPSDFHKSGRRRLIDLGWKRMAKLTQADRLRSMNRLVEALPANLKTNDDYQRLFRLLTRNER